MGVGMLIRPAMGTSHYGRPIIGGRRFIRPAIQFVLISAGVTMMVVGMFRGEAMELLRKAVVVCMECIGIG